MSWEIYLDLYVAICNMWEMSRDRDGQLETKLLCALRHFAMLQHDSEQDLLSIIQGIRRQDCTCISSTPDNATDRADHLTWLEGRALVNEEANYCGAQETLAMLVRRAAILCLGSDSTDDAHMTMMEVESFVKVLQESGKAHIRRTALLAVGQALADVERAHVRQALKASEGEKHTGLLLPCLHWARWNLLPLAARLIGCRPLKANQWHDSNDSANSALLAGMTQRGVSALFAPVSAGDNAHDGCGADASSTFDSRKTEDPLTDLRTLDVLISQTCHLHVAEARIEQAFALVRDFPDSTPALIDLRDGLSGCEPLHSERLKAALVRSLVLALRNRLLHPGVATGSIVDVFLSLVRACRLVDSSGLLGALAGESVRAYLRTRHDTVRYIIASMTEDEDSVLHAELQARTGKLLAGGRWDDTDDNEMSHSPADHVTDVNCTCSQCEGTCNGLPEAVAGVNVIELLAALSRAESLSAYVAAHGRGISSFSEGKPWAGSGIAQPACTVWLPPLGELDMVRTLLRGNSVGNTAISLISAASGTDVDLLACLVGIYGSNDSFVAEYRLLLGEKLLARGLREWDLTGEDRVLELLKLRFGDSALASAEVMLRDIVESKRASTAVADLLVKSEILDVPLRSITPGPSAWISLPSGSSSVIEVIALSGHYWPSVSSRDKVQIHEALLTVFNTLAGGYAEVRKPRKLALLPTLGIIEIDLDLPTRDGSGTMTMSVSGTVAQASILCNLAGRPSMPLSELAAAMALPSHSVLRMVQFWVSQGILSLMRDDRRSDNVSVWVTACLPLGSDVSAKDSTSAGPYDVANVAHDGGDPPEAIEVWKSYIAGMLGNLGPLALDRIHSTLKMFASMGDHPYEKGPAETARFLSDLVRADFLVATDGLYKLHT